MNERSSLKLINLLSFIFLQVASFIFAKGGGLKSIEVKPVFSLASYAFSIWSIIYIALAIWLVWEFMPNPKREYAYRKIGYFFALTMIFMALTILVPINLSVIFIIISLMTAAIMYYKISQINNLSHFFRVPFSLLLSWLTVATLANISLVLKNLGVTKILGLGEVGWAILLIIVGAVWASTFLIKNNDAIYPLVFIWAYVAIAIQNQDKSQIVGVALIMSTALLLNIIYNLYFRNKRY